MTTMNTFGCSTNKLLSLLLLCALAASCRKDNDPAPVPTAAELIIGRWYLEKVVADDGHTEILMDNCEKNTRYEFEADGTLTAVAYRLNGEGVCKGTTLTAEYSLTADENKIAIEPADSP